MTLLYAKVQYISYYFWLLYTLLQSIQRMFSLMLVHSALTHPVGRSFLREAADESCLGTLLGSKNNRLSKNLMDPANYHGKQLVSIHT